MEYYRNLKEYMEATHQTKSDIIEDIADAALTLLLFVDEGSELEFKDIVKLSEPLHTLHNIVTKVNESINPQRPESV